MRGCDSNPDFYTVLDVARRIECLLELDGRLRRLGKRMVLSRVKDPVRELLLRCQPEGLGDPARLYWSVADAVQAHVRLS